MNFLYLDTSALKFALQAGGAALLDKLALSAQQTGYTLRITDAVVAEITISPQRFELRNWLDTKGLQGLTTQTQTDKIAGLIPNNAGEYSIVERAKIDLAAGDKVAVWSDDTSFKGDTTSRGGLKQIGPEFFKNNWFNSAEMINDFATRGTITASEFEGIKADYRNVPQFNPTSGSYSGPNSPNKLDMFKTAAEIEISKTAFNALTPAEKVGFKHIVLEHAPTGLKVLGTAAIAYDVVTSTAEAARLLDQGSTEAAALTMSQLAGRLYLGLEGAAAGFALGNAAGPIVGLIGAVAGGIAGAVVGDKAVEMLWAAGREVLNLMGVTQPYDGPGLFVDVKVPSVYKQLDTELKNAGVPDDVRKSVIQGVRDKYIDDAQTNPDATRESTIESMKADIQAIKDAYDAAPKTIEGATVSGLGEDGNDTAYIDADGRRLVTLDKTATPFSDDKLIVQSPDGEKTSITVNELNGTTIKREDLDNHQPWQTIEDKYQRNPTGVDELSSRTTKLDSGQSSVTTLDPSDTHPEVSTTAFYDSEGASIGTFKQYDQAEIWHDTHALNDTHLKNFDADALKALLSTLGNDYHGTTSVADGAVPSYLPSPLAFENGLPGYFDTAPTFYDVDSTVFGAVGYDPSDMPSITFYDPIYTDDISTFYINPYNPPIWTPTYPDYDYYDDWFFPIVLDLDNDGVEVTPKENSSIFINLDGDAAKERTAWVGAGDGLLVIDLSSAGVAGGDGLITQRKEFAFADWTADPNDTDAPALRAEFDSNLDGKLTSTDTRFGEFRVWKDVNQNGVSDSGELQTLALAGISEINLSTNNQKFMLPDSSVINGFGSFVQNGVTKTFADVALNYNPQGFTRTATATGVDYVTEDGHISRLHDFRITNPSGGFIDVASSTAAIDYSYVGANAGNVFYVQPTVGTGFVGGASVSGGSYNDWIYGNSGNDVLSGGAGTDKLYGGGGDDIFYFDNFDNDLKGDAQYNRATNTWSNIAGYDTAIWTSTTSLSIQMHLSQVEAVIANSGHDVINAQYVSVGTFIDGKAGDDKIYGSANDDILVGGLGADLIWGNAGGDLIQAGAGNDGINGQDGDDSIWGGDGNDNIAGGLGDDIIQGGAGADTINGEAGADSVIYNERRSDVVFVDHVSSGFWIDLNGQRDTLNNIETVVLAGASYTYAELKSGVIKADNGDNTLAGTSLDDVLEGLGGNDILQGGFGDNILRGGDGNDVLTVGIHSPEFPRPASSTQPINYTLYGKYGHNILLGGSGNDTLRGGRGDTIDGGEGDDTVYWTKNLTISSSSIKSVKGGSGYDTIILDDYSISDATLHNNGFELIIRDLGRADAAPAGNNVSGNNLWTQSGTNEDGDNFVEVFDNGTLLTLDITDTGANDTRWQTKRNAYNADGKLTSQSGTYDDGSSWQSIYDAENLHTYNSYLTYYSALGQTTLQTGLYDSGDTWEYLYSDGVLSKYTYNDLDNSETWKEYSLFYDTAGQITKQVGVYDPVGQSLVADTWEYLYTDGVLSKFTYNDLDNSENWKEYSYQYNTVGQITQQNGLYDGGDTWEYLLTDGVLSKYTYADLDNSETWKEYSQFYDAAGQIIKQVGFYDLVGQSLVADTWETLYSNGVLSKYTYADLDNSETWKEYSQLYDAAGQIIKQVGVYDIVGQSLVADTWGYEYTDGVISKYIYSDLDNSETWKEYSYQYNATGQAISQSGIYDNGTTWEYIY